AQVLLESVALERKPVSPNGLAFVSGQVGVAKSAAEPVLKALAEAKLPPSAVRRLTCFLNSLEHIGDAQSSIAAAFPSVPASFVQLRRDSTGDFVECESVASLESPPSDSPQLLGSIKGRYSQVAVVGPGLLVLTGVQLGFGAEASDIRLAFERLKRTLEGIRASPDTVVFSNIYPLSNGAAEQIRKTRLEFWNADRPPASTLLLFEGLSSPDATFGIEAVAVPRPR
ncbi:MAG TPA: RidA family protein, partial [Bryobacteraceae bacterium]|nr:RidA family protein [Bryobacteraceae bacterium]